MVLGIHNQTENSIKRFASIHYTILKRQHSNNNNATACLQGYLFVFVSLFFGFHFLVARIVEPYSVTNIRLNRLGDKVCIPSHHHLLVVSAAAFAAAAVSLCNRQHSTSSHHPVAVSQQDTDLADKTTITTYLSNDQHQQQQQQQPILLNHVLPIIQLSDYEANLNDWLSRIVIFKIYMNGRVLGKPTKVNVYEKTTMKQISLFTPLCTPEIPKHCYHHHHHHHRHHHRRHRHHHLLVPTDNSLSSPIKINVLKM
uniref:Uncharacterized protein n=1 Tax=Glossina palpalis gambiensis TaxID=67801 RepID=A0A1B0B4G5_9MUSC